MSRTSLFDAIRIALQKQLSEPIEFTSESLALRKGMDGSYNLLGKFSNRWRDVDFHSNPLNGGEIVVNDAHEEFCKWLDKNPQHALELWSFHHWGTARKNRANWWDYNGNSFYMNWPLTEEEAKSISNWTLDNEPGMSFGFYSFGYDNEKGLIKKYRAFEASILPKKYAANPWASFQLHSQENDMAFNPDKRKLLVKLHGEEFVKDLEKDDAELAELLDKAGVETKEATPEVAQAEVVAEVATATADTTTFASQKEVVEALGRMEEAFGDVIKALVAEMATVKAELAALKDMAAAEAKAAATPLSILAAYMPKSIIEQPKTTEAAAPAKSTAQISGNSSLARSTPKMAGTAAKRNGVALTISDIQGGN